MYQSYKDRAAFLFVYVQEAHPDDGWQMPANVKDGVVFQQPKTMDSRCGVARQCCERLKLSMPCVVDSMDNRVDEAYAAWPERMFVIDSAGTIVYAGKPGPFGFKPQEVETWLRRNLSGATAKRAALVH
jgi:hypothetical protein